MTKLTREEREAQILLSRSLGPIFPLYGIVERTPGILTCECRLGQECPKPGKHPRLRGYRQKATTDPERIRQWFRRYDHANYGVMTGPLTIALDVDVRPNENGWLILEYLEIGHGKRIPFTVEVLTGRGNGSRHLFFKTPSEALIRTSVDILPGLDVRAAGGYACAAGSRHLSGGYYHFPDEYSPDEQSVAELPDFLLAALAEDDHETVSVASHAPSSEFSAWPDAFPATRQPALPDAVVLGVMIRDPVARRYWNGGRRNHTRSEDDFALACKLAFYCCHRIEQMYRLFMRSGLRRSKFEEKRPGGNYALWTLTRAIKATPQTWIRRKRKRPSTATGAKKGRKPSPDTIAVLDLHKREPTLTGAEIAARLALPPKQVRDALYYHGRQVAENARTLIHSNQLAHECLGNSSLASDRRAA